MILVGPDVAGKDQIHRHGQGRGVEESLAPAPQKPRGFNTASSQISYLAKKWRIFFKIDPDRRGPVQER